MTEARTFKIRTSLARQMAKPGGRTLADAERLANDRLEGHRPAAMASVADAVERLERLVCEATGDSRSEVYRTASSLLDIAGFFDTGPLYEAGYSLCEIADRMSAAGVWNWPAVEVHVRAMRLIMNADGAADLDSEALLAGLRAVAARVRGAD